MSSSSCTSKVKVTHGKEMTSKSSHDLPGTANCGAPFSRVGHMWRNCNVQFLSISINEKTTTRNLPTPGQTSVPGSSYKYPTCSLLVTCESLN
jgi:hypothetical protein